MISRGDDNKRIKGPAIAEHRYHSIRVSVNFCRMLTTKIIVIVALCCAYAEAVAVVSVAEPTCGGSIPCSCKVCQKKDCPLLDCPQVICVGSTPAEPDSPADNTEASAAALRPFPPTDNCLCVQCEEEVECPTCPPPCSEVQP